MSYYVSVCVNFIRRPKKEKRRSPFTNPPSVRPDAYTRSDSNAAAGLLGGGVPGFTP